MRTTVNIDDGLLAEVKQLAARNHASLGDVIDDALRVFLAQREKPVVGFDWGTIAIEVPGDRGIRPGLNWRSNSAMLDAMEDL